ETTSGAVPPAQHGDAAQDDASEASVPRRPGDREVARAVRQAQGGDLTGAERELQALARRYPERDDIWTNLGILQERLGQSGRAKESYEKALALQPGQDTANLNLVRLAAREGTLPAAEADLQARLSKH